VKVLALIWADESGWAALPPDEQEAWYERYRAFGRDAADAVVGGAELSPTRSATTVRVRGGDTVVTDGPFAETREQLGGYYVLDVENMDVATSLAAKMPGASHGAVELRPAYEEEPAA
jgi:hypothetical protein